MGSKNALLKILLIEDGDFDALLIQNALRQHKRDAQCTRVTTLKAGEDILREGGVDLLLLDLGLPDTEEPRDTYERIRKWTHAVPVIIMTSLEDHEFAKLTIRGGVEDFLSKDIIRKDPERIDDAINFAIERHTLSRQAEKLSEDKDALLNYYMGGYSVAQPSELT